MIIGWKNASSYDVRLKGAVGDYRKYAYSAYFNDNDRNACRVGSWL